MDPKAVKPVTVVLSVVLFIACGNLSRQKPHLDGRNIRIEFNESLRSRVVAKLDGKEIPLGGSSPSELISISNTQIADFRIDGQEREKVKDAFGSGQRLTLTGTATNLKKTVTVTVYDEFPTMAFFDVQYTNVSDSNLNVDGWTNNQYRIQVSQGAEDPVFWSYQSGSYESRPDWVLPLKAGFQQENYMGMNASDYGGGTPVVDIWNRDIGIGVGHVEPVPKLISLPVNMPDAQHATVAVSFKLNKALKPGETLKTFRTFVAVHRGDYSQTLSEYRRVMAKQGFEFTPAPEDAFSPVWCAWGYGRNFKARQVYGALPIVKKLGFGWVTLDDGWQTGEGDWFLNRTKFPNGDRDIRAMVDKIHAEGFKAQLWWAPLAVDPGTTLIQNHPEQLLLNADGSKRKISWWNSWYLCPADPQVVKYHKDLVKKIMDDWRFDGLKLDGQRMNGVPPCYNSAHGHTRPEESVEAVPTFFKMIYDTARSIKPDSMVEFCPCGTGYSFFTMPYMNMAVASDPESSWQIRLKGKTLKALMGDSIAYFGDHVDRSDGGDDFASTVGIGGVVGTNFTWPPGSAERGRLDLTAQKEKVWAKWTKIYKDKMLPKGEYLGTLYDIGFDKPETHAIRKNGSLYYAFYAPDWKGDVEIRGLEVCAYRVTEYVDGKDLGKVQGPTATVSVEFKKHLLLEATPE